MTKKQPLGACTEKNTRWGSKGRSGMATAREHQKNRTKRKHRSLWWGGGGKEGSGIVPRTTTMSLGPL